MQPICRWRWCRGSMFSLLVLLGGCAGMSPGCAAQRGAPASGGANADGQQADDADTGAGGGTQEDGDSGQNEGGGQDGGGQNGGKDPTDESGEGGEPNDGGSPAPQDILAQFPEDDMLDGSPNAEYLGSLNLAHVQAGESVLLVWLADTPEKRSRGLMFVTDAELADAADPATTNGRGMLFVFEDETMVGFWMRNTITPLDVAYIRENGVIDSIQTMKPLDETPYPPDGPYLYALEVPAGTFAALELKAGDTIGLPKF